MFVFISDIPDKPESGEPNTIEPENCDRDNRSSA